MVKAVKLNNDGMLCISTGSDHTLRLWDVGQRKCLKVIGEDRRSKHQYNFHKDSIWTFEISNDFTHIYTGGKDGHIFRVNIVESTIDQIYSGDKAFPIISLKLDEANNQLWYSTPSSTFQSIDLDMVLNKLTNGKASS